MVLPDCGPAITTFSVKDGGVPTPTNNHTHTATTTTPQTRSSLLTHTIITHPRSSVSGIVSLCDVCSYGGRTPMTDVLLTVIIFELAFIAGVLLRG